MIMPAPTLLDISQLAVLPAGTRRHSFAWAPRPPRQSPTLRLCHD